MALDIYLAKDFNHTHEREMFEKLSDNLSSCFCKKDGILVGNIFCNGGEIDCLLFKNDGISVIEMKDYSGKISKGGEEGRWIVNGTFMGNPYQQVRNFKFKLLEFLQKNGENIFGVQKARALNLGHISGIVLFRKNADYDKREELSPASWKWFHVSDLDTIEDTINKITSTELITNENEWSNILEKLNIDKSMRISIQNELEVVDNINNKNVEEEKEAFLENQPSFNPGENIIYVSTGKVGTINKVLEGKRGYQYKVTIEGEVQTISERFLEPHKDREEQVIDNFLEGNVGTFKDYKLFNDWLRITKPIEGNLYSYLSSKTIFNPHQFKPLLRFLSPPSDERLFIADEVGVGKTIEAGIILKELLARKRLNYNSNILIVCPNSLTKPKWFKEMKERFNLNFHVHDGDTFTYSLESTLQEGFFPKKYNLSIVSLQLARRDDYLDILKKIDGRREERLFDMVIIDEAHHLRNKDTKSYDLGELLSGLTDMMLMLSATPLNLKNEDLFNQMKILNPTAFPNQSAFEELRKPIVHLNRIRRTISKKNVYDKKEEIEEYINRLDKGSLGKVISSHPQVNKFMDILNKERDLTPKETTYYENLFTSLSPLYYSFTRTRKRVALEHQVHREVLEVPIELTEEERDYRNKFLNSIIEYYERKGIEAIQFAINIHRRMISSCMPATTKYIKWCLIEDKILSNKKNESLELGDDTQIDHSIMDEKLKSKFKELLESSEKIKRNDSKYIEFRKLLEKILLDPNTSQIIVFSFFVRTLKYLKKKLETDGYSVGIIHGDIPHESTYEQTGRNEVMEGFKDGEYDILLSSEVGGEGLDFQYCHAMVNYDLPYNPMRVEQRIGRLDRFGQKSDKILVANFFIKDTVDEEIYDRLYRRISVVEDGVGALEPILEGNELKEMKSGILSGTLTDEQKEKLSIRLKEHIESSKLHMEELEKIKSELIGDDYLSKPINKITDGEFVGPEDAIDLTNEFLSSKDNCKFTKENKATGKLVLSNDIVSDLERFLRKPGNEGGYVEVQPLLQPKTELKVVFNGDKAIEYPNHVFVPPTGMWTKFITHELEDQEKIKKCFSFKTDLKQLNLSLSECIMFLFEVRFEGFRTEIQLFGIPVDVNKEEAIEVDYTNLPRKLVNLDGKKSELDIAFYDPEYYLSIARGKLDEVLENKRKETADDNKYKIESRIAAIEKSSDMKISKLRRQMHNHIENRKENGKDPDRDYIRMTEARIEKEKSRVESKKESLEQKREISLNYNLEGIVYLKGIK